REGGSSAAPDTCFDKNCEQVIDDLESAVASFPSPFLVEKLAALYWQRHASAGRVGRELLGNSGLAQLLAGRAATHTGVDLAQITVAIRAFEKAIAIAPDQRKAWEDLARLHQVRMAQLVGDERTDELEKGLEKVEAFHAEARKRFPNQPLQTSLAGALFEV